MAKRRRNPTTEFAALGGLIVFVVLTYTAFRWEIARELTERGVAKSSVYWDRDVGLGLVWGGAIALPGILLFAITIAWVLRARPHVSARQIVAVQGFVMLATLIALRYMQAPGVLIITPLAGVIGIVAIEQSRESTGATMGL